MKNNHTAKSLNYLEGEIAHTERSVRKFRQIGNEIEAKDREQYAKELWQIYHAKKEKQLQTH